VRAARERWHVIVVGGGFAGLGCARKLAKRKDVHVTLLDRNNYHQFQPMLYQVATSLIPASNIVYSLRKVFRRHPNVDVKLADVASIDPASGTVTATDGGQWSGDAIVLAAGSEPNFFGTPGADRDAFPLYSLEDANRLRSRIIGVFEHADRDPSLLDRGALTFVVVGGGPTGVETAGALADMIRQTMPMEYRDLPVAEAQVHIVDMAPTLLGPFSPRAHEYVDKVLGKKGVQIHVGAKVERVAADGVTLGDGTRIKSRCVVWGGGIESPPLAAAAGVPQGGGGRIDVTPELAVPGFPRFYAIGDVANICDEDGEQLPQLGSVALQSGRCAAANLLADFDGAPPQPFRYRDKGIMAMIGRGAAIAEMGKRRREVHGIVAFGAWLGVHTVLMTGIRNRILTFVDWGWAYLSKTRGPQVLDRATAAAIDWGESSEPESTAGARERAPMPH